MKTVPKICVLALVCLTVAPMDSYAIPPPIPLPEGVIVEYSGSAPGSRLPAGKDLLIHEDGIAYISRAALTVDELRRGVGLGFRVGKRRLRRLRSSLDYAVQGRTFTLDGYSHGLRFRDQRGAQAQWYVAGVRYQPRPPGYPQPRPGDEIYPASPRAWQAITLLKTLARRGLKQTRRHRALPLPQPLPEGVFLKYDGRAPRSGPWEERKLWIHRDGTAYIYPRALTADELKQGGRARLRVDGRDMRRLRHSLPYRTDTGLRLWRTFSRDGYAHVLNYRDLRGRQNEWSVTRFRYRPHQRGRPLLHPDFSPASPRQWQAITLLKALARRLHAIPDTLPLPEEVLLSYYGTAPSSRPPSGRQLWIHQDGTAYIYYRALTADELKQGGLARLRVDGQDMRRLRRSLPLESYYLSTFSRDGYAHYLTYRDRRGTQNDWSVAEMTYQPPERDQPSPRLHLSLVSPRQWQAITLLKAIVRRALRQSDQTR